MKVHGVLLPVNICRASVPRRGDFAALPRRMAIIVTEKGTLDGKSRLVMADELMGERLASCLTEVSKGSLRCSCITPDKLSSEFDSAFLMHHGLAPLVRQHGVPMWLWVHNPGHFSSIEIRKAAWSTYQRVFHAGSHASVSCGLLHLPHTLEDQGIFKSDQQREEHEVSFVGNKVMHENAVPLLLRLMNEGVRVELRGAGWREAGIPSAGRSSIHETATILSRSMICLDDVSEQHKKEGMISTRLFQCLACGSCVVTLQDSSLIPLDLRKHMVFADGYDDAYNKIRSLLRDPLRRARIASGARAAVIAKHTMIHTAKTIWGSILADSRR